MCWGIGGATVDDNLGAEFFLNPRRGFNVKLAVDGFRDFRFSAAGLDEVAFFEAELSKYTDDILVFSGKIVAQDRASVSPFVDLVIRRDVFRKGLEAARVGGHSFRQACRVG